MWEDIAMGIIIVCGANLLFGSVLGFLGYLRYLKHKETIALAEHGFLEAVSESQVRGNPKTVRAGIILMAVGTALCIGLYPIGWIAMPGELPLNLGPWMLAGLLPFCVGAALLIINYLPSLQLAIGRGVQRAFEHESAESDRLEWQEDTLSPKSEDTHKMNV